MDIAGDVRNARRKKGWTQAELAQATGLSRWYIVAIETRRARPRFKTLVLIAEALGVDVEELQKS